MKNAVLRGNPLYKGVHLCDVNLLLIFKLFILLVLPKKSIGLETLKDEVVINFGHFRSSISLSFSFESFI